MQKASTYGHFQWSHNQNHNPLENPCKNPTSQRNQKMVRYSACYFWMNPQSSVLPVLTPFNYPSTIPASRHPHIPLQIQTRLTLTISSFLSKHSFFKLQRWETNTFPIYFKWLFCSYSIWILIHKGQRSTDSPIFKNQKVVFQSETLKLTNSILTEVSQLINVRLQHTDMWSNFISQL